MSVATVTLYVPVAHTLYPELDGGLSRLLLVGPLGPPSHYTIGDSVDDLEFAWVDVPRDRAEGICGALGLIARLKGKPIRARVTSRPRRTNHIAIAPVCSACGGRGTAEGMTG